MEKHHKSFIPNNILLQVLFLLVILFLLFLIAKNLVAFLPGLLGAICLFVLLLAPYRWLYEKKKWNKTLSIISLMFISSIAIIGPLYLLVQTLSKKVMVLLNDKDKIENSINKAIEVLRNKYQIDVFSESSLNKVADVGGKALESVLNASFNSFVQIGVAYLLLYFMLSEYNRIEKWFYHFIPLRKNNLEKMKVDMKKLVISNAVGVPLTAFLQAIIAYIGYLIFGVDDSFMFFVLTIFAAMLPVVGAALIYIPLVIMLLAQGETGNAIGLLIYSFVVVGLSDNLIRFALQKKMADIHPLITIFGVIVGLNLFGFIGIIFGPILFSLLIWLLTIYRNEFVIPNED
ncbi:AI-2E family transporter [Myroides guanonis]|uniref:Predicted PurR-regulated permease PerM n=1 Tax=Myroides guanonis TaxID=1150112 RepID=A0A1I3NMV1_9FLAO|nr:AI-2E family transporter [Myroides guanonis]SFJ10519.1 Predicted PurR-regulated permease PerM [Myroides guanonis]